MLSALAGPNPAQTKEPGFPGFLVPRVQEIGAYCISQPEARSNCQTMDFSEHFGEENHFSNRNKSSVSRIEHGHLGDVLVLFLFLLLTQMMLCKGYAWTM